VGLVPATYSYPSQAVRELATRDMEPVGHWHRLGVA
jgi:hypothetical protein